MPLTTAQRLARLLIRTDELRFWLVRETVDLNHWRVQGEPLSLGAAWPTREGVLHFTHSQARVPAGWPLDHARLLLDLGGEGLVTVAFPDGQVEAFGLDAYHHEFPLRHVAFTLQADVVARRPFGVPEPDPRLAQAQMVLLDHAVERLIRLLRLIAQTVEVLGEHDVIEPMLAAAERALATLDWPTGSEAYLGRVAEGGQMQSLWTPPAKTDSPALDDVQRATVAQGVDVLQRTLRDLQGRFPRNGMLDLTGHAHLDLAWLWPMEETRRKAQRTYSTVIALMERYPEFRFNQSSAQIYAFLEDDAPELFAAIREFVRRGQWEPVGGMWVEPDTNMPGGEALCRQLLYGQRYFRRTFGRTHTVCWLPDCFGFSPALPQLLRQAGIENFFTIKLNWSETNVFPYDLFRWEGLDGSHVLAHMFNNPDLPGSGTGGYNADTGPYALVNTWRNFRGKQFFDESLLSIGYGDGGGGVTPEMIEQTRVLADFPVVPATHFGHVDDFYARLQRATVDEALPVWQGELYLELHRGTLTTQGRTKYLHRRAERNLAAAETLASLDHLLGGIEPVSLERQWQVTLRNEFHDILPGSSIHEVYTTAEGELASVVQAADTVIAERLRALAARLPQPGKQPAVLVVNPDLSARRLRLSLASAVPGAQPVEGGSVLCAETELPGLSIAVVQPPEPPLPLDVSARQLVNRFVRVTLADDGTVAEMFDLIAGREALAGRGNQLWAYVDKPAQWDAWDVDAGYADGGEELPAPESITVVEEGPYRAAIRVVRRFRQSTVTQDIRLWANSPRLEFFTTLEWHDRRLLLKARFPLAVRARQATFETAFGVVERPTHRNTSWDAARFEVAGHRFADLSEPGYGVALLNDGKYGHHALGNELGLSLLRSPIYPDPYADEGTQSFTYALLPHRGGWLEGGVLAEAEDLNRPLLGLPIRSNGEAQSWRPLVIDGLPLGLGTLKVLEDGGGLALRVYEPHGARGKAAVTLPEGWRVDAELDLLEQVIGEARFGMLPFEVRTWRIRE